MNDNTNKRNMIILGVMGVVLVVVLGRALMPLMSGGSSTSKSAAKTTNTPTRAQVQTLKEVDIDADELLNNIRPVTFIYESERIERNPMTPLVGTLNAISSPTAIVRGSVSSVMQKRVTGIVWDKYNPAAIVDEEIVTKGHEYPDGVRVYSIEPDQVTFQVGDTRVPIKMKEL